MSLTRAHRAAGRRDYNLLRAQQPPAVFIKQGRTSREGWLQDMVDLWLMNNWVITQVLDAPLDPTLDFLIPGYETHLWQPPQERHTLS